MELKINQSIGKFNIKGAIEIKFNGIIFLIWHNTNNTAIYISGNKNVKINQTASNAYEITETFFCEYCGHQFKKNKIGEDNEYYTICKECKMEIDKNIKKKENDKK
jgi:hypothetical protein